MAESKLDAAIEEVRAISEWRALQQARKDHPLLCPDCGCELEVVVDSEAYPHGVIIKCIRHRT